MNEFKDVEFWINTTDGKKLISQSQSLSINANDRYMQGVDRDTFKSDIYDLGRIVAPTPINDDMGYTEIKMHKLKSTGKFILNANGFYIAEDSNLTTEKEYARRFETIDEALDYRDSLNSSAEVDIYD